MKNTIRVPKSQRYIGDIFEPAMLKAFRKPVDDVTSTEIRAKFALMDYLRACQHAGVEPEDPKDWF